VFAIGEVLNVRKLRLQQECVADGDFID